MRRRTLVPLLGIAASGGLMLALGGDENKFILSRGSLVLTIDHDTDGTNEVLQVNTDGGAVPLAQIDEDGLLDVYGPIETHDYLRAWNTTNDTAAMTLSFESDIATIRVGGNGAGNQNGLQIESFGNANLMRLLHNGDVGIGTETPLHRLSVRDSSHQIAVVDSGNDKTWTASTVADLHLGFYEDGATQRLLIESGGNVGINVGNPEGQLHIVRNTSPAIRIDRAGTFTDRHIDIASDDSLRISRTSIADDIVIDDNGFVGIGTSTPDTRLEVNGTLTTDVLTITGGGDLSERFDIAGGAEPGTVVSIDPENPGRLRVSATAYDRTVAGVVSACGGIRPGMTMGQDGSIADGASAVALTGRVYVRCVTAGAGPIVPGDLLTTSDVSGCAMKATDHARAAGAVLGKAMTRLDDGEGLVLVLVSLQ